MDFSQEQHLESLAKECGMAIEFTNTTVKVRKDGEYKIVAPEYHEVRAYFIGYLDAMGEMSEK